MRPPDAVQRDVNEELDTHLQLRVEELVAQGMSIDAARAEARRQFGDLQKTRQYCIEQDQMKDQRMRTRLVAGDLLRDVKVSLRGLWRAPLLTITVVMTVGLGIGATTAIFSGINAAFLQPLPYADPERLFRIYTDHPPFKFRFSVADYLALQAEQTHFERIAGFTDRAMAWTDGATAERVQGREVTWTYFGLLDLGPIHGRDFTEFDSRPGNPRAVILSDGFWRARLGGQRDALGKSLRLDGSDYTIVGVLPPTLGPLERARQFFVAAQYEPPRRKGPFFITALGRLRPGVDRSAAAAELHAINRRMFPIWRSSYPDDRPTWALMDLKEQVIGTAGTIGWLSLASVGLLWLISCVNASNLLVARVTSRRRELAVRTALGASRARVIRHLLVESALLAIGAATVGVALAMVGMGLLRGGGATYFPRTQEIAFDGPVFLVLASVTAMSCILFGLVPAMHGTGGPIGDSLRTLGRSATATMTVRRMRRLLVGTQFAIATPLLVVAGLLLVSLNELRRVDLGFDTHNVVSGSILLPVAQYKDPGRVETFWEELKARTQAIPGVSAVTYADGRPPSDVGNFNNFDLEDHPTPSGQSQPVTPWVAVTPDYFRVLGITLVAGRLFDEQDRVATGADVDAGAPSLVVDRAWQRRFFPNGSAVGKRLKSGGCTDCPWTTVVGVVSEVKYAGLSQPDQGSVYTVIPGRFQDPELAERVVSRSRYLILRTSVDAAAILPVVRQVVRDLDPTLPFNGAATMDELVAQSLQRPEWLSRLIGGLAVVALLLSIIGIYGVMAHYVQQHIKDMCIRMALGGRPADVLRLIVGDGMRIVVTGVAIGVIAAFFTTRLMSSLLFGVSATDAMTFIGVTTMMLLVSLMACWLPARRALRAEPAAVLRNE